MQTTEVESYEHNFDVSMKRIHKLDVFLLSYFKCMLCIIVVEVFFKMKSILFGYFDTMLFLYNANK